MSGKVHVMDHPLVAHKLTILRDKNTSVKDFREIVSEIGMLITYEATRDLPLTTKEVETPVCKTIAPTLKGKKFAIVPILRAGLGLVDGVLRMVPGARVGRGLFTASPTAEDVQAYAAQRLAPHKKIRLVEFIEQVPKSMAGKILRKDLKNRV